MKHFLISFHQSIKVLMIMIFLAVLTTNAYPQSRYQFPTSPTEDPLNPTNPPPSTPPLVVTNGNNSGAGSLRQVIADAPAGSIITFSGVNTVTLSTTEILLNKNLTIDGGNGVTINGAANSRILNITGNQTVTLISLGFTNGQEDMGGAIFNNSSNLEIIGCLFENNLASERGGAIYNNNASPRIINSFFAENRVIAEEPPVIECTAVTNVTGTAGTNTLSVTWSSSPVALSYTFNIRASSDTQFDQFTLDNSENSIDLEGLASGTEYIYFITTNCTNDVSSNTATFTVTTSTSSDPTNPPGGGGGGGGGVIRTPPVEEGFRVNNVASQEVFGGGAIFNEGSSPRIVNTVFFSNSVSSSGGPLGAVILNVNGSNPQITNTTFGGNEVLGTNNLPILSGAAEFGTITNIDGSGLSLTNSIIWGNPSGSIVGSGGTVSFSSVENGPDGTGNQNLDPLFVNLSTGDLRLQPNSPLRNAGNPSTDLSIFPGGPTAPLDLDANPRVVGGIIDMGAYELELNLQPQTITISPPTALTYGDMDVSFNVTTTSGLPVTYAVSQNDFISVTEDGTGLNALGATDTPVEITVSVVGNETFEPASTTLSLPVQQRQLIISDPLIDPKEYDGNLNAEVSTGALQNLVGNDDVEISASAVFDNANAGIEKTVTVSYSISGTDSGNYFAPDDFISTDGTIVPRQLVIAEPDINLEKEYDGNVNAEVSAGALQNIVGNENLEISTSAVFDNANAGTGKIVRVSYSIFGTDSGNYFAPEDLILTDGIINPRQLIIADPDISLEKEFDGNNTAEVTAGALQNRVGNDAVEVSANAEFDDANVGTGKTVTVSYSISGESASNYFAPEAFISNVGIINPRQLIIADPDISLEKEYDGNKTAEVIAGALQNRVGNDAVEVSANAEFDNANAGTGKTVTVSYSISGTDAGNYLAPVEFISTDGVITLKDLFVTPIKGQRKAQGSEDPDLEFEVSGFVDGEDESILTGQLGRESGESCGDYEILNEDLSAGSNYTIIVTPGVFFEIFDDTPPTLALKNISVQLDNSGNASITITDIDNGTMDNCSTFEDLVFEISETAFTCENTDPITVNVKVSDLTGNSSEGSVEITVLQPLDPISTDISSTVAKNQNGNVVIYANAPARLAVPESTVLQAVNIPDSYTGLSFEWFVQLEENGEFISISQSNTITVLAEGDFVRTYKVVVTSDSGCVAEEDISVVSIETSCDIGGNNKVQVCHLPGGNFNRRITICVNVNALDAFLENNPGSFVGNCNVNFRLAHEPEVIDVPWNTSLETIEEIIYGHRETWFGAIPELDISSTSYNPIKPGLYELIVDLDGSEGIKLEESIRVRVQVLDKPLPTSIELSNLTIPNNLREGDLIALISTIDPVDDVHTYHIEGSTDLQIQGNQLLWNGSGLVPGLLPVTIFSTDRAGQTISKEVRFTRESPLNEFLLYPNPAGSETNIKVLMDVPANVNIILYDLTGKILINETAYQEDTFVSTLKLDGLAAGVYLVQVKVGHIIMTKRLIKN